MESQNQQKKNKNNDYRQVRNTHYLENNFQNKILQQFDHCKKSFGDNESNNFALNRRQMRRMKKNIDYTQRIKAKRKYTKKKVLEQQLPNKAIQNSKQHLDQLKQNCQKVDSESLIINSIIKLQDSVTKARKRISKQQRKQNLKYKILSPEQKMRIVKESYFPNSSITQVAYKYQVSVNNILRWRIRCQRKSGAGRKLADEEMQKQLLQWINNQINFYKYLNQKDNFHQNNRNSSFVTLQCLKKKDIQQQALRLTSNPQFKASKGWYQRFLSRNHNIKQYLRVQRQHKKNILASLIQKNSNQKRIQVQNYYDNEADLSNNKDDQFNDIFQKQQKIGNETLIKIQESEDEKYLSKNSHQFKIPAQTDQFKRKNGIINLQKNYQNQYKQTKMIIQANEYSGRFNNKNINNHYLYNNNISFIHNKNQNSEMSEQQQRLTFSNQSKSSCKNLKKQSEKSFNSMSSQRRKLQKQMENLTIHQVSSLSLRYNNNVGFSNFGHQVGFKRYKFEELQIENFDRNEKRKPDQNIEADQQLYQVKMEEQHSNSYLLNFENSDKISQENQKKSSNYLSQEQQQKSQGQISNINKIQIISLPDESFFKYSLNENLTQVRLKTQEQIQNQNNSFLNSQQTYSDLGFWLSQNHIESDINVDMTTFFSNNFRCNFSNGVGDQNQFFTKNHQNSVENLQNKTNFLSINTKKFSEQNILQDQNQSYLYKTPKLKNIKR